MADLGVIATAAGGWDMVVPPLEVRDSCGLSLGYQYIHLQAEEYSCAVHRYAPYSVTMPGVREESGVTGTEEVVVEVGTGIPSETGIEG